jgi:hypothetical protein
MTENYGEANPSMKMNAPMDRLKTEGPEENPGFGSDYAAGKARSDRPGRRSTAANPLATYAKGGKVKGRAWGGPMQPPAASGAGMLGGDPRMTGPAPVTGTVNPGGVMQPGGAVRPMPMAANGIRMAKRGGKVVKGDGSPVGNRASGGAVNRADGGDVSAIEEANRDQTASSRARGGRTGHKKGSTHVTVVVAPQGGGNTPPAMPMHPPVVAPMMPPRPPMAPPMPPAGGPPGMPPGGAAPMIPAPGMMPPRASGGRVGSLEDQGLSASDKPTKVGQKTTGYTGGALSGPGRLEKIEKYGRKTANATPQKV